MGVGVHWVGMGTPDELRPLFLLSDEPLTEDAPDDLGRDRDARLIAEVVLGNRGPFAVGVYGEWGTGKTTLLHQVRRLLTARTGRGKGEPVYPYVVTVHFNAWQHGREKSPIAFLAAEIHDALARHLAEISGTVVKAETKAVSWLRSALDAARAAASAVTFEAEVPVVGVKASLSGKDAVERYEALQKGRADPDSKVWKDHVARSVAAASLRSMRADEGALADLRLGEERRAPKVVVFVDDLDRCTAQEAVTVLREIKLALAQPGFVFVMTLNPSALQPYVQTLSNARGTGSPGSGRTIYLDKLIQLPYPLRLRRHDFGAFCTATIEVRMKASVEPALHATLVTLRPALRDCSLNNPRTFKRLVNAVLIAAQRASRAMLAALDPDADKARALFAGMYLLYVVPERLNQPAVLAQLAARQDLCDAIAEHSLDALAEAARQSDTQRLHETASIPLGAGDPAARFERHQAVDAHKDLILALDAVTPLNTLFKAQFGQRWLKDPAVRAHADHEWSETPPPTDLDPPPPPQPPPAPKAAASDAAPSTVSASAVVAEMSEEGTSTAPTTPAMASAPTPTPAVPTASPPPIPPPTPTDRELAGQIAIIERAVRDSLRLTEAGDLTPQGWADVKRLVFQLTPLNDQGIRWLSRPDRGLRSLGALYLHYNKATVHALEIIASPGTGLSPLTTLSLKGQIVSDAGLQHLARSDTGLKQLNTLLVRAKTAIDQGIQFLARPDTGLKHLTTLGLADKTASARALESLARADTGLSALTHLDLSDSAVTDESVEFLARPDTGLKALTTLNLSTTAVTDRTIHALRPARSGLRHLSALSLSGAKVTLEGVRALAHRTEGLRGLDVLSLSVRNADDEWLRCLAGPDSGLVNLTTLNLLFTGVTDEGLMALIQRGSALSKLTLLNLPGTVVSASTRAAFEAKFPRTRLRAETNIGTDSETTR